ncbi:integrase core domain-containing protein [Brevundimonas intermedia]
MGSASRPSTVGRGRAVIERWRIDYNYARPHSAHGD